MKVLFSDKELLKLIRVGDSYGFKFLYEKHIDLLFNYGFHICHEKELTEDVIQDVFIEIWNKKERLPEIESLKAYLLKSVRYKLIRKINKDFSEHQRAKKLESFVADLPTENQIILDEMRSEIQKQLRHHINLLPHQQREVVFHIFFHNLNHEEVAAIMGLTKKTIYNLLHSALARLRREVKLNI